MREVDQQHKLPPGIFVKHRDAQTENSQLWGGSAVEGDWDLHVYEAPLETLVHIQVCESLAQREMCFKEWDQTLAWGGNEQIGSQEDGGRDSENTNMKVRHTNR